jgi:hypothetical protein
VARKARPLILIADDAADVLAMLADLLRHRAMPIAGSLVKPARREELIRQVEAALRAAA